jgi:hypothetical protein
MPTYRTYTSSRKFNHTKSSDVVEFPGTDTAGHAQFRDIWLGQVAATPEFTASDLAIAITLARHINSESREAWPSIARMAMLTGRNRRTIIRSIERLERTGTLTIRRSRGRRPNRYALAMRSTVSLVTPFNPPQQCHPEHLNGDTALAPEPLKEPMKKERSYAWEGRVIRLTAANLNKWQAAYPEIPSLQATLQKLDDYYAEHPPQDGKWFFRVSRCLANENATYAEKRKAVESDSW